MTSKKIDLQKIKPLPLVKRKSLSTVEETLVPVAAEPVPINRQLRAQVDHCAERIRDARSKGAAVMLIYGAHMIKNGAALILDNFIDNGWLTHLATNGAGTIHDWEYAWLGRSTECVRCLLYTSPSPRDRG